MPNSRCQIKSPTPLTSEYPRAYQRQAIAGRQRAAPGSTSGMVVEEQTPRRHTRRRHEAGVEGAMPGSPEALQGRREVIVDPAIEIEAAQQQAAL